MKIYRRRLLVESPVTGGPDTGTTEDKYFTYFNCSPDLYAQVFGSNWSGSTALWIDEANGESFMHSGANKSPNLSYYKGYEVWHGPKGDVLTLQATEPSYAYNFDLLKKYCIDKIVRQELVDDVTFNTTGPVEDFLTNITYKPSTHDVLFDVINGDGNKNWVYTCLFKDATPASYTLTVSKSSGASFTGGTPYINSDTSLTSTTITEGTSVTVHANPDSSHTFVQWQTYPGSLASSTSSAFKSSNADYTFNMPAQNLTLFPMYTGSTGSSTGTTPGSTYTYRIHVTGLEVDYDGKINIKTYSGQEMKSDITITSSSMDFEVQYSQKFTGSQVVNLSLTGSYRTDGQVPQWESDTVCDLYYNFVPDWGTYTLNLNIHTNFNSVGYAYDMHVSDNPNGYGVVTGQYYCTAYDFNYANKDTHLTDAAQYGIFTVSHKVSRKWAYASMVKITDHGAIHKDEKVGIPIEWSGNIGTAYVEFTT